MLLLSAASAERAVLLLADATGHGVGPALSVTEVRAMLRMGVRMGARLETIASHMNEQLCDDLQGGRFISAWLGDLDAVKGTLTCFSAGQGPVIVYHASTDTCEVRLGDTRPLGILPALEPKLPEPLVLTRGDVLLVASDGIHEAENRQGQRFGIERIEEVVRAHRQDTPGEIIHALRDAVIEFAAGAPASDDRTMLIIKRTGR